MKEIDSTDLDNIDPDAMKIFGHEPPRKARTKRKPEVELSSEDFTQVLNKLLEKDKIIPYQICKYTHLDQSYLSRLRNGEKNNPSTATLIRISLGMVRHSDKITIYDIERLFKSTGRSLGLGE